MADVFDELDIFDELDPYAPQDIPLGEMQASQLASYEEGKPIGRAGLELFGTGVGTLAKLPTLGTAPTEALGYAAGSKAADLIYGEDTGSFAQKTAEGLMWAGIPRAIGKLATPVAKSVMKRAIKIPPAQAKAAVRERAVETLLSERIGLSKVGLSKTIRKIGSLDNEIEQAISAASQGQKTIDADTLYTYIAKVKHSKELSRSPDAAVQRQILESLEQSLRSHSYFSEGKITLEDAHQLKKGIYEQLNTFYRNAEKQGKSVGASIVDQTKKVGKASYANALREEIIDTPGVPKDIVAKLKKEGGLVNAKRWAERAVNRAENHDIITFNDVLLGTLIDGGIPKTVGIRILRAPRVQSRLAIWFADLARPATKRALQVGLTLEKPGQDLLTP
jgi:hypothetical protein